MTIRIPLKKKKKKKKTHSNEPRCYSAENSVKSSETSNTEEAWKIHEGFERNRKLSQARVSRADGLIIGGRLAPA